PIMSAIRDFASPLKTIGNFGKLNEEPEQMVFSKNVAYLVTLGTNNTRFGEGTDHTNHGFG
ncbi:MAG: hypothetical protein VW879_14060, partial [Opitutae bacterium]